MFSVHLHWVNLSKRGGKTGFSKGWYDWLAGWLASRAAPRDFLRAKPEGNPDEQAFRPEENPIFPDSLTQIYILFILGICVSPPNMHKWFSIGLTKNYIRFCIGPS